MEEMEENPFSAQPLWMTVVKVMSHRSIVRLRRLSRSRVESETVVQMWLSPQSIDLCDSPPSLSFAAPLLTSHSLVAIHLLTDHCER